MKSNTNGFGLVLMRHAQAEPRSIKAFPDDSIRPLTAKGRKEAKEIGKALFRIGFKPSAILTSPFLRTVQTAELAAKAMGMAAQEVDCCDCLSELASPLKAFRELRRLSRGQTLLIVGHQPFLGAWLSLSLTGKSSEAFDFRKGGLAFLGGKPLVPGRGQLLEFVSPSFFLH